MNKIKTDSEKIHKEISEFYDNISAILGSFGFYFIWIPKVKEDFISLSPDRLKQIIEYLYPEKQSTDIEGFYQSMMRIETHQFATQIMTNGTGLTKFRPSLLFKISSSSIVCNDGRQTVDNFIQLPISDNHYTLQKTIQCFTQDYIALLNKNKTEINHKYNKKFNLRGFHKTFLDISFALNEDVPSVDLLMRPRKQGKDKKMIQTVIRFGMHEARMSLRELSYYLLIIYLLRSGKQPLKDMPNNADDEVWRMFDYYYMVIYSSMCKFGRAEERCRVCVSPLLCESFRSDNYLGGCFHHIIDKIKHLEGLKNATHYYPVRDEGKKEYLVKFAQPLKVIENSDAMPQKETDFVEWVDEQASRYKR